MMFITQRMLTFNSQFDWLTTNNKVYLSGGGGCFVGDT